LQKILIYRVSIKWDRSQEAWKKSSRTKSLIPFCSFRNN